MKNRLDVILAERSLARSRTAASLLIKEGSVRVNGVIVTKPSEQFDDETDVFEVSGDSDVNKYAGRGGLKLETAIEEFGINLDGAVCIDIGASTGGFTDCMLQNGAAKVYAVDVGTGQLAEKLRQDSRVISLEQLDIRKADSMHIPEKADFIGADVSFISLKMILPEIKRFAKAGAAGTVLIKPQFELGKKKLGKNGVVKDAKLRESVVSDIITFAGAMGFEGIKTVPSKITGGDGNVEYLMYFRIP